MRLKRCGSEMPRAGKRRYNHGLSEFFHARSRFLRPLADRPRRPADRSHGPPPPPPPARSAPAPALTRYLVDPAQQAVATVEREAGPAALLRAAHRIGPDDWLPPLAPDTQTRGRPPRPGRRPRWP